MDQSESFSKNKFTPKSAQLCRRGEDFVCSILTQQNWQILHRNFRRKGFELDIVCKKANTLIVVEVKTRRKPITTFSQSTTLLPHGKQLALMRGLEYLMAYHSLSRKLTLRIDLAVVVCPKLGGLDLKYFPAVI